MHANPTQGTPAIPRPGARRTAATRRCGARGAFAEREDVIAAHLARSRRARCRTSRMRATQ